MVTIFSIDLKNVLTMMNGYTRQFWKELEELTHSIYSVCVCVGFSSSFQNCFVQPFTMVQTFFKPLLEVDYTTRKISPLSLFPVPKERIRKERCLDSWLSVHLGIPTYKMLSMPALGSMVMKNHASSLRGIFKFRSIILTFNPVGPSLPSDPSLPFGPLGKNDLMQTVWCST